MGLRQYNLTLCAAFLIGSLAVLTSASAAPDIDPALRPYFKSQGSSSLASQPIIAIALFENSRHQVIRPIAFQDALQGASTGRAGKIN